MNLPRVGRLIPMAGSPSVGTGTEYSEPGTMSQIFFPCWLGVRLGLTPLDSKKYLLSFPRS